MSLKRATFAQRPRTRETIAYRLAKIEREERLRERRAEKNALKKQATEH